MRLELEAELGIEAYNNYGLSEVIGPGVSGSAIFARDAHQKTILSWNAWTPP